MVQQPFERTPGQVLYRVKGQNSHVWIHGNQNALNHITFKLALDSHCLMIFWELFAVINCGMPQAPWTRSAISRLSSADASTKWQKGWTQQLYAPHRPAPYDRSTWQLALINFQAGLIQAAEFQQLLCLFKWCSTCKSGFGEIPILGSCVAPLIIYILLYNLIIPGISCKTLTE